MHQIGTGIGSIGVPDHAPASTVAAFIVHRQFFRLVTEKAVQVWQAGSSSHMAWQSRTVATVGSPDKPPEGKLTFGMIRDRLTSREPANAGAIGGAFGRRTRRADRQCQRSREEKAGTGGREAVFSLSSSRCTWPGGGGGGCSIAPLATQLRAPVTGSGAETLRRTTACVVRDANMGHQSAGGHGS